MASSSTEAGYLAPDTPGPDYDDALEDLFQATIVGITGIPGNLVRPRWQPEAPNTPGFDVDWIAFGLQVIDRQWNSYQVFDSDLNAYTVSGTEVLHCNVSFYGPHLTEKRRRWEDGLQVDQNLAPLHAQGIKYIDMLDPVALPALFKNRWRERMDMKAVFHRWATRIYPVTTLVSVGADLDNERYHTPIVVNPPSP
jgi:hypothetical protein